jgi:hypothetical protein
VGTLLFISVLIGASYYQSLPKVEHIPENFVFPPDTEYVGYVNYAQAFFVTGNNSIFGKGVALQLSELGFALLPTDINYEVEIQLTEPKYSGSATILQLTADKETLLLTDLASYNTSRIRSPETYDGHAIYQLLMLKFGDQTANLGFMTIINNHLILSNDKTTGLANVQAILDQITANNPSLFDNSTVRKAIYSSGVTDQNYAGLFIAMFQTQLNDTKMAVKSVTASNGQLSVSRSFMFPTSDLALERLDQAHQFYKDASSYRVLDSWLVVTYNYPLTRMQSELIGL